MSSGATLALFARLIVSLGVVIGLMWFAARVVRRRGLGGVGSGGQNRRPGVQVDIVARRTLGRNASIAVVRAGNQHMVVGVTDHMITKLGDADLDRARIRGTGGPMDGALARADRPDSVMEGDARPAAGPHRTDAEHHRAVGRP